MKKVFFTVLLLAAGIQHVSAQKLGVYRLETSSGATYTPLTAGSVVSPGLIWLKDKFQIPLGFTAKLGNKTIDHLSIVGNGMVIGTDTLGTIQCFTSFLTTPLRDRYTSSWSSPIRYTVTGVTPNRIFKLEIFNAGFDEEHYTYGSTDDSVNVQYWLYESSNIFEIRYGGSKLTYPSTYFASGTAPVIGHLIDFNIIPRTVSKLYALKNTPAAPAIDSVTSVSPSIPTLSAYPPEGTVYRFVPESSTASISASVAITGLAVYPTHTSGTINISYTGEENINLHLLDASGRELEKKEYRKGVYTIDLSRYVSGMYLLDVAQANNHTSYKVFKK